MLQRYDTTVQEPFRVSKACIEPSTAGDKVTIQYIAKFTRRRFFKEQVCGRNSADLGSGCRARPDTGYDKPVTGILRKTAGFTTQVKTENT